MKEGLRSGRLRVKDEKNGDKEKQEDCDKGVGNIPYLDSGGSLPARESLGDGLVEESEEDGIKGKRNDRLAKNEGSKEMVDSGEKSANIIVNNKLKTEEPDVKEQIVGRVLRSRSAVARGNNYTKDEDVSVEKSKSIDDSEIECVDVKEEMGDQLVEELEKKPKGKRGRPPKLVKAENSLSANGLKMKKRKRGRPCKVENNVIDELDDELIQKPQIKCGRPLKVQVSDSVDVGSREKTKRKRGRPPKMQVSDGFDGLRKILKPPKMQVSDGFDGLRKILKRKRGRPPKVKESDASDGGLRKKLKRKCETALKVKEQDTFDGGLTKKIKLRHGRFSKVQVSKGKLGIRSKIHSNLQGEMKQNAAANSSHEQGVLNGEGSNVRFSSPKKNKDGIDLETKDDEASLEKISKATVSAKKKMDIREEKVGEMKPSTARKKVRDKIVEILVDAGWTIEYRPRNGRAYEDAVYVNPLGKTHWSVTLAYEMLKMHYENGDSKVYRTGFQFDPIPEQELSILKKVIVKERDDKGKSRKEKGKGGKNGEKKQRKKLMGRAKEKEMMRKQKPHLVRDCNRRETQGRKRCALLARSSMEGADLDADGYILYDGKRTILSWMIDLGTVSLDEKVHYMNRRKTCVLLEGRITRDGIHCGCCNEIVAISKFEIHSGSKLCEPYKNIFLESGTSLLQCLLDSWNKQLESERKAFHLVDVNGEDPNDDTCGICGDGGDLICCDGCPSTFHQSCLDIKKFPSGDWHCVYCSCKFCLTAGGNTCQNDDNDCLATSALLTCQLCEEKYHQFCNWAKDAAYDDSCRPSFCGKNCEELFKKLHILLGVKHEMEEGFSWTLVRRSDVGSSKSLLDAPQMVECYSNIIERNTKVAVALSIMDECFLPIVDHRSGINLIHNIVYNCESNFNRLNYSGFFTAILERGDEIVSAASIRIHGNHFAEMPFIGTRYMYRRQGMCRRLLSAVEYVLRFLDVERLVIPAIAELRETWISIFGFKPLEVSSKKKMKNKNMLVFPGVDLLQKPLLKLSTVEETIITTEGSKSTELNDGQSMKGVDGTCLDVSDLNVPSEEILLPVIDSEFQLPDGPSHDTSTLTSEIPNLTNCATDPKPLALIGMSQDNVEVKEKKSMNSLGSLVGLHEHAELMCEHQHVISDSTIRVPDGKKVELDRRPNHCGTSEDESKSLISSFVESEATFCGRPTFCALKESTDSAGTEGKIEDNIVKSSLNSHNEGSTSHTTKIETAEPQEKASLLVLNASGVNSICHDSETNSQLCTNNKNFKCHSYEDYLEDKMMDNHQVVDQQPSIKFDGISAPFDTKCCGAHLEGKGVCKAKDVKSNSLVVRGDGFQDQKALSTMALADAPTDVNDRPQVNSKSLKQPEFNSHVHHAIVEDSQTNPETLCKMGNASAVALHCASGGANSCSAPEAIILSNQAS